MLGLLGYMAGGMAKGMGDAMVKEGLAKREAALKMLDYTLNLDREERDRAFTRETGGSLMTDEQGNVTRILGNKAEPVLDATGKPLTVASQKKAAASTLGKLRGDLESGYITQEQYDALAARETAPPSPGLSLDSEGRLVMNTPQDSKNAANRLDDERNEAKSASRLKDAISVMRQAQENAGYTGVGGEFYDKADQVLEGISGGYVGLPGSPEARAVLKSGGLKFVMEQVEASKGAISDKEMEIFRQASPGLGQTPAGNKILLDIAEKVADRQLLRLQEMELWRSERGSLDGFESAWSQWIKENPIVSTEAMSGGSTQQSGQASSTSNKGNLDDPLGIR